MFRRRRSRRGHELDHLDDQVEPVDEPEPPHGPYDADEAPDDHRVRLDLGGLRIPVPDGAQLQVEMDKSGPVRAVHLVTGLGQLTINAFAAPRSGGLWQQVRGELVAKLKQDQATVNLHRGEWGMEVHASTPRSELRFVGVDGARWMVRGVATGPAPHAEELAAQLREVIRETIVVRGVEPLPVRSPLPLQLPEHLAAQLKQAGAGQTGATAPDGGQPGGG